MILVAALSGCLIATDAYQQRRDELAGGPGGGRTPDAGGALVRVIDAWGQPGSKLQVEVNGDPKMTDGAGLAWVPLSGPAVITAHIPDMAPTGLATTGFDGFTGATLELVPLMHETLAGGEGVINEAGRRSLAFPPGTFDAAVDVEVPYAWGDGRAPAATDGTQPLDLYDAVYLGDPTGAGQVGPVMWRIAATDDLRAETGLALYRFDETSGAWSTTGTAEFQLSWLEAELPTAGAWYAFAAPASTGACPQVLPTDQATGSILPGTELLVRIAGRASPVRVVSDSAGVGCLAGQSGAVALSALRGVDGDVRQAWFDEDLQETLVAGGQIPLELSAKSDGDSDGNLAFAAWDCDDNDPTVAAGAEDLPGDGLDSNCDGVDGVDRDGDGAATADDCDPLDPLASPDGTEICDGVDNDCDGSNDNGEMAATSDELSSCQQCNPQTIADLRPVLYFPFDDVGAKYTADYSGWGRDLQVVGGFSTRWPGIAEWDVDTPYWIGDTDTFLWLEDQEGFWPSDHFTISVWLRPEFANRVALSYESDRPIHVPYSADGLQYSGCNPTKFASLEELVLHSQLTRTVLKSADLEADFEAPEAQIPLRTWTHLAVVRDGPTASIYVNGFLTEQDVPFTCEDVDDNDVSQVPYAMLPYGVLRIGQNMNEYPTDPADPLQGEMAGVKAYEGTLDELAVFDRVLTAAEVSVLFHATACDEGLSCDGVDDDGDATTDEHLLGTKECPADDPLPCQEIVDTESAMGIGPYTIDLGVDTLEAWCDVTTGSLEYCGDGVRSPLTEVAALESCDEAADPSTFPAGALDCDGCVADLPAFKDCQEVLDADPTAPDGAYRLDFDGPAGPHPPVAVRCDMEGGVGWTLVFAHDSRAGVLFNDPRDADGACPALETDCTNGVDEGGADQDADIDCADSDCFTDPACVALTGAVPENLLCTDASNCACACPNKVVTGDNTSCIGPLGSKFSVVDYLDAFQDRSSYVQYRLRWPFHELTIGAEPVDWCQDWLPFETPPSRSQGWCFDPTPSAPAGSGFAGLAPHGWDTECVGAEHETFDAFDGIDEDSPTDTTCSNLFAVGLTQGNQNETSYGIPSNKAHGGDFSSKTVELWVRRGDDCPTPCGP